MKRDDGKATATKTKSVTSLSCDFSSCDPTQRKEPFYHFTTVNSPYFFRSFFRSLIILSLLPFAFIGRHGMEMGWEQCRIWSDLIWSDLIWSDWITIFLFFELNRAFFHTHTGRYCSALMQHFRKLKLKEMQKAATLSLSLFESHDSHIGKLERE